MSKPITQRLAALEEAEESLGKACKHLNRARRSLTLTGLTPTEQGLVEALHADACKVLRYLDGECWRVNENLCAETENSITDFKPKPEK